MGIEIKKCAVLGAGVMGAQIAGHISNAGIPSLLFDINEKNTDIIVIANKRMACFCLFFRTFN